MEAKKAKAILLRHRYDNLEQLRRHLHVVDGATLIFFRDPKHKMRFMTLMTPTGDTTMSFADTALKNRLEIGAIAVGSAKDYSLRLLHSDGTEAWKPPVRNEVTPAASR